MNRKPAQASPTSGKTAAELRHRNLIKRQLRRRKRLDVDNVSDAHRSGERQRDPDEEQEKRAFQTGASLL